VQTKVFKSNKRPVNQIAKTAGINQGTRYTDLQPILSLHFVLEIGNIIRHSHCCSSVENETTSITTLELSGSS
jgi:hypothetical protein